LRQYPNHRLPDSNQKITAQEWTAEFSTRQKELTARYNTFYSSEHKHMMQLCKVPPLWCLWEWQVLESQRLFRMSDI
jgi:hypothetical protein